MTRVTMALGLAGAAVVGLTGAAEARDQIRIVGSSTVYPFATAVAEQFGTKYEFPTPVVESTGTGGGLKLFCAGVGEQHPDMTNASRRIKEIRGRSSAPATASRRSPRSRSATTASCWRTARTPSR